MSVWGRDQIDPEMCARILAMGFSEVRWTLRGPIAISLSGVGPPMITIFAEGGRKDRIWVYETTGQANLAFHSWDPARTPEPDGFIEAI